MNLQLTCLRAYDEYLNANISTKVIALYCILYCIWNQVQIFVGNRTFPKMCQSRSSGALEEQCHVTLRKTFKVELGVMEIRLTIFCREVLRLRACHALGGRDSVETIGSSGMRPRSPKRRRPEALLGKCAWPRNERLRGNDDSWLHSVMRWGEENPSRGCSSGLEEGGRCGGRERELKMAAVVSLHYMLRWIQAK